MKRWVRNVVLPVVGLLAMGVSSQAAAAKAPNAIDKAYSQVTSAPLIKPDHVTANTVTTFDIVLQPRNKSGFFKQAMAVNTPGSSQFKHYLTPSGIRESYGQSKQVTNQWQAYLKKRHLKAFVYDNGLLLSVSGKVKYIDKLFKVNLNQATYHTDPLQFGKAKPHIPDRLAKTVWTVLGMGDHNKKFVFPDASVQMMKKANRVPKDVDSTKQFASDYNVNPLYKQGLTGKGQTVGIISFGDLVKSNAFKFWQNQGASTRRNRLKVESVPGNLFKKGFISRDESETTMDVEYAGAVAPKANIKVYWEHNVAPTFMNTINAYSTAFNENQVGSISNSWGLAPSSISNLLVHRKVLPTNYLQVLNLIIAQGALQGISCFTASGDTGALINSIHGVSGNKAILNRTVSDSDPISANPWITSCGGTIPAETSKNLWLNSIKLGNVSIKKERSWGFDWAWHYLENHSTNRVMLRSVHGFAAGGGGFSHLNPTPAYQLGVPGVNTFNARQYISYLAQPIFNSPLIHGKDSGRNYPDVSANTGGLKGYLIYQKEKKQSPWVEGGGTSIVSPQYAGITALINSQSGRQRMGFWNAQIYQLAQQSDSPFHPLNDTTNNSNMYYTGQPGTVYNQASGLGTTDFAKLSKAYQ
ncbi:S53 family peptidase [Lentilactobacillus kisonensis]|uniref:Pro-kumamolisin, activation domain protein n=1 Tax=Lentilactobacillus kisonensis DSM 19906 = JCM 15041 TaxID=1423766 RepID=A0A0R1NT19_9LACO|nr:S53 family peptidase [Lentilactobacillus kisonensis]KRL20805.1 Pro-kumamolisin, activation domain protein [Lentilactobacillus kisonensis DSM 19906 = JCM 15041]